MCERSGNNIITLKCDGAYNTYPLFFKTGNEITISTNGIGCPDYDQGICRANDRMASGVGGIILEVDGQPNYDSLRQCIHQVHFEDGRSEE